MQPIILAQARALSSACCARYQYDAAAWYANKAVTLSGASPRDVYALADAYFAGGDATRALRTLELYNFLDADQFLNPLHAAAVVTARNGDVPSASTPASRVQPQWLPFFYLAALCLGRLKAWSRCIALLEACMEGSGAPALIVPLPSAFATVAMDEGVFSLALNCR